MTWALGACAAPPDVSLATLLDEMGDRSAIARWPAPEYTAHQASSYDRASVAPDAPGWFANSDRSHFVRVEPKDGFTEHVLMDEAGPGAIVRFWGTWHGEDGGPFSNGTLRIYLDGAETPAIEGPMADVLSGEALAPYPLSYAVAPDTDPGRRGHNLFLPIPYQSRCLVTYSTDAHVHPTDRGAEALYYQIGYRRYPPGTRVETFSMASLAKARRSATSMESRLRNPKPRAKDLEELWPAMDLVPGGQVEYTFSGPAAIDYWSLVLEAPDLAQALHATAVEWTFDGRSTVWCPVRDFFGSGRNLETFETLYTAVGDNKLESFWVMPFARSARIRITNLGRQTISLTSVQARVRPWDWENGSMHFHADWSELAGVKTWTQGNSPGAGAFDVTYLQAKGRGVLAGDGLAIFNPVPAWWGEGDEKIYVDGESFPSHFGTGTEDYYGYAWCRPETFATPFHAQPVGAGNITPGFSVNTRMRALDAVPFQESLQFDMEMWHWVDTKMDFAPVVFWYGEPGARSVGRTQGDSIQSASRPITRSAEDLIPTPRVSGAIEAEEMLVIEATGGTATIQNVPQFLWSGHSQIWWRDASLGDRMELAFQVASKGRYELIANLTKANDYGIVQLEVNGTSLTEPLDRYHETVAHNEVSLGVHDLVEGSNSLLIKLVGSHPKAAPKYMFGLDYLRLVLAK